MNGGGAQRGGKSLLANENECFSVSGSCVIEDAPVGGSSGGDSRGAVMNDGREGGMRNMLLCCLNVSYCSRRSRREASGKGGGGGYKWERGCLCLGVMESDAAPVIPVTAAAAVASHTPWVTVCGADMLLLFHHYPVGEEGGAGRGARPGLLLVAGTHRTQPSPHRLHYGRFTSSFSCFA